MVGRGNPAHKNSQKVVEVTRLERARCPNPKFGVLPIGPHLYIIYLCIDRDRTGMSFTSRDFKSLVSTTIPPQ